MLQHKALVLHSHTEPPKLTTVPTPEVQPGQAIVRVLAARLSKDTRGLITGKVPFPLFPSGAWVWRHRPCGSRLPDAGL